MKKLVHFLLSSLLLLTGCLSVEQKVILNKDGSGTVEEKISCNAAFAQMMNSFSDKKSKKTEMFSQKEAKEKATKMGKGVKFVSFKKLSKDENQEFIAVYKFNDITTLKLDQSAGANGNASTQSTPPGPDFAFKFTKGDVSTLIVDMKQESDEPKDSTVKSDENTQTIEPSDSTGNAMLEMLKPMFQDFKISTSIEFKGTITETNATYRNGNKVTLLEMDFGRLIEDSKNFTKLTSLKNKPYEEVRKELINLPGIKFDLNDVVKISFK